MSTSTALLIEDDPDFVRLLEHALAPEFSCQVAAGGARALEVLEDCRPDVAVLDLGLPDMSGKEVLERLRSERPELAVLVLTASTDVQDAVECIQLGAVDFLTKPCDPTRILTSVRNARQQAHLAHRLQTLTAELRDRAGLSCLLGACESMERVRSLLARGATSDVSILLLGESGSGKEVAARAIHSESERCQGPFIAVNCGAIPEALIESELFGHVKGAFTGAVATRPGKFEQADGGTIFLDEVGELRLDLQVKLLRVLQERVVERLGDTKERRVDFRLVAATNRDLKERCAAREFREDLYYRLAVFPIELPPLRARGEDVLLLAERFLERLAQRHGRGIRGLSSDARAALAAYSWPGNVRELENVIERAVILEDGAQLSLSSLPDAVVCTLDEEDDAPRTGSSAPRSGGGEIRPFVEEEKRILSYALEVTEGNVKEASRRLGIGRATLYRKIERYGLR